jgi:hypothetical protein
MTGIDLAETILSLIVFASVFLTFLWWQHSRDAKRRAKEMRDQTLHRLRSRDC